MRWLLPLVLLGCPIPSSRDPRVPDRVRDHAEACAEVLGPIPAVDCREGVRVQITADGEAVGGPVARCDAPSMLAGQCNPYSRVGRIPGQLADGSENPDVDFVFICRVEKDIEGDGPYGIVAMIGHDRATGGTCYFQASDDLAPRQVFPSPQRIPRTAPSVEDWVWQPPEQVAAQDCNTCHMADPWLHSPWIDSAKLPGTDEPVVPRVSGPDAPYHVIGAAFAGWRLQHFALEGNGCTACHRVAPTGCDDLLYSTGHPSAFALPLTSSVEGVPWMPPVGSVSEADIDEVLDCCAHPTDPACNLTDVPRERPPTDHNIR